MDLGAAGYLGIQRLTLTYYAVNDQGVSSRETSIVGEKIPSSRGDTHGASVIQGVVATFVDMV